MLQQSFYVSISSADSVITVFELILTLHTFSVLTPPLCLTFWGVPYRRGFNCDDESLRYPYQENTISSVTCYLYSTTIPLVLVNEFALPVHSQQLILFDCV